MVVKSVCLLVFLIARRLNGLGYDPFAENATFELARRAAFGGGQALALGGGGGGEGSQALVVSGGGGGGVYRMDGLGGGGQVALRDASGFAVDDGDDDAYDHIGDDAGDRLGRLGGGYDLELGDDPDGQDEDAPDRLLLLGGGGGGRDGRVALGRGRSRGTGGGSGGGPSPRAPGLMDAFEPLHSSSDQAGPRPSDGRPPLPGFVFCAAEDGDGKRWAPPRPPPDFRPYHVFPEDRAPPPGSSAAAESGSVAAPAARAATAAGREKGGGGLGGRAPVASRLTAAQRQAMLGEPIRSDPAPTTAAAAAPAAGKAPDPTAGSAQVSSAEGFKGSKGSEGSEGSRAVATRPDRPLLVGQNGAVFGGFAGLAASMASRFAKGAAHGVLKPDTDHAGLVEKKKPQTSDSAAPNGSGAAGNAGAGAAVGAAAGAALTARRVTTAWAPETLLCRRFNVPPPDGAASSHKKGSREGQAGRASSEAADPKKGVRALTTDRFDSDVAPFLKQRPAATLLAGIGDDGSAAPQGLTAGGAAGAPSRSGPSAGGG